MTGGNYVTYVLRPPFVLMTGGNYVPYDLRPPFILMTGGNYVTYVLRPPFVLMTGGNYVTHVLRLPFSLHAKNKLPQFPMIKLLHVAFLFLILQEEFEDTKWGQNP
jgi:hypothetical protein